MLSIKYGALLTLSLKSTPKAMTFPKQVSWESRNGKENGNYSNGLYKDYYKGAVPSFLANQRPDQANKNNDLKPHLRPPTRP